MGTPSRATAALYNGLGRYGEALTAALRSSAPTDELGPTAGALIEVVEAAMRSDAPELRVRAGPGLIEVHPECLFHAASAPCDGGTEIAARSTASGL
jgi:hypothetical protein